MCSKELFYELSVLTCPSHTYVLASRHALLSSDIIYSNQ